MNLSFVFPGQGSQFVGMGKEWLTAFPKTKEIFQEVDEALQQNLSKIIFEGPDDQLVLTENTQPALMAVSLAIMSILKESFDITKCHSVAGHSLGEYSALASVGTFSLWDTAKLLKIRGQAMQNAVPVGQGMMAAILGLNFDDVSALIKENNMSQADHICCAANDNAPGQVVISGHKSAVEAFEPVAKAAKAKRFLPLPVSAPFHSPLMQPAAEAMDEALSQTDINTPLASIYMNVTAEKTKNSDDIHQNLVQQVTDRVRWRETIENMARDEVETIVEIGAGKVLTGLCRRIQPSLQAVSIQTPEDLDAFFKSHS